MTQASPSRNDNAFDAVVRLGGRDSHPFPRLLDLRYPQNPVLASTADRPFAYLYAAGRYDTITDTYRLGATVYNTATGVPLGPGYDEMGRLTHVRGHVTDPVHDDGPGFWESLIPYWGSKEQALADFERGDYGWAIFNTVMAISDVFLVKAAVVAGAKLVVLGGIRLLAREGAEVAGRRAALEVMTAERGFLRYGEGVIAADRSLVYSSDVVAGDAAFIYRSGVIGMGTPAAFRARGAVSSSLAVAKSLAITLAQDAREGLASWARRAVGRPAPVKAVAQQEVRFFKSIDTFKSELGPAGEGNVWHHIVEQRRANIDKFGAEAIHNTQNVVAVPRLVNQALADFYSTKPYFTRGKRVREWLGSQSWREQYEFGQKMLNNALSGQPLP